MKKRFSKSRLSSGNASLPAEAVPAKVFSSKKVSERFFNREANTLIKY